MDQGIAPLMGLETALAAIRAAQGTGGRAGWRPWPVAPRDAPLTLMPEPEAKALLAAQGIPVPRGVSAPDLSAVLPLAQNLSPPLVLKGIGFAHKTEAGAVRLHLSTLEGQADMPGSAGYLAEEMVTGALAELLIGARRDPVYGATLTIGFGGVTAELLDDTATLVLPVTGDEIRVALRSLRLWPLLDGYRGRARANVAAVVEVALALQAMLAADRLLAEIEINPLMVTTDGAIAVDAVIWREET